MDEYAAQAKASWGDSEAYREYERKSKGRSDEENRLLGGQMMDIFAEFGSIRSSDPAEHAAQVLVKKLQGFISEHYYTCTKDILRGLGQMYAGGGDMTANIDRCGGDGTAAFAAEAIRVYCR
ncbi:MAG: TipAS antibiotic-recognition domain-containing protein [Oscillospiraceae bacterium]|nr:TipAS antibiotic-recognition domain-containing protein [Oscillospiraceae bacterium]